MAKPFSSDPRKPNKKKKQDGLPASGRTRKPLSPADPKKEREGGKLRWEKNSGSPDFDRPFPLGDRKLSGPFRKKERKEEGKNTERKKEGKVPRPRIPVKKDESAKDSSAGTSRAMTLNKYIAHSDQCSRREAAEWIKQGKVKVNGLLELNPGYRVQPFDEVTIAGKKLKPTRHRTYILLNKPKGLITTTDDPQGRPTVMDLVSLPGGERLYPVGRLDRNTTGLLLLTNDGDLAQRLSHPSYEMKKVYQVEIDKPLTRVDFEKIRAGITLPDGPVTVDEIAYLDRNTELGLEIHSGRNRIVRRLFESLGYEVLKLDRVLYAGLTKKNLPRGKWRHLEPKEVVFLKHFSKPGS